MSRQITDLRNHLFATIEALKDPIKPMDIDRAKAICQVGSVIVETAKVEVAFLNAAGGKGTGFIEQLPALQRPRQ